MSPRSRRRARVPARRRPSPHARRHPSDLARHRTQATSSRRQSVSAVWSRARESTRRDAAAPSGKEKARRREGRGPKGRGAPAEMHTAPRRKCSSRAWSAAALRDRGDWPVKSGIRIFRRRGRTGGGPPAWTAGPGGGGAEQRHGQDARTQLLSAALRCVAIARSSWNRFMSCCSYGVCSNRLS